MTLASTAAGILIQIAFLGVGSVVNLAVTISSAVGGLLTSLVGHYLIAMRRGAELLDGGLRRELHGMTETNRILQDQLTVPSVSLLERDRRELVKQKLDSIPSAHRDLVIKVLKYILQHGEADPVAIIAGGILGSSANAHPIQDALAMASYCGLTTAVPGSYNRRIVVINSGLKEALTYHLLGE